MLLRTAITIAVLLGPASAFAGELLPKGALPSPVNQDAYDFARRISMQPGSSEVIIPAVPEAKPYDALVCNNSDTAGVFKTNASWRGDAAVGRHPIAPRTCLPLYGITYLLTNAADGGWFGAVLLRAHRP